MKPDLLIVGAGLSGGLLAFRLAQRRPDLSVRLIEAERPGGNHTWSFHEGDLSPAERHWIAPFVTASWPAYEVRFPERKRRFDTGYASISRERFADALAGLPSPILTARVASVSPDSVHLESGERIEAGVVVDARGPRETPHLRLGFQKFLGQEVEFEHPHGLVEPIVMDATVAQRDGYRFVYCLPFTATRMLIEDTYYADGESLDRGDLRRSIRAYAHEAGWGTFRVLREEDGVLPIALGGDIDAHLAGLAGVSTIGLAGALFHPTTGYSLPDAVRTADLVAGLAVHTPAALSAALVAHCRRLWRERAYFRALNRMLFLAGAPSRRYRVLQHFHRLPEPVVSRFYAARLTGLDKARILIGKPPVPVARALSVIARDHS